MKFRNFTVAIALLLSNCTLLFSQDYFNKEADKIIKDAKIVRIDAKNKSLKYFKLQDNKLATSEPATWLQKNLKASKNHSFREFKRESDKIGHTHRKYQVFYKNIPVEGFVYNVHSKDNKHYAANGEYFEAADINTTPQISEPKAFELSLQYVNARKYAWQTDNMKQPNGLLTILPIGSSYVLAYKFDIYASEPLSRQYIFVDANTGEILKVIDRLHIANASGTGRTLYNGTVSITTDSYNGTYRLRESGRGNGIETYNLNHGTSYASAVDFTDIDNNWTDTIDNNHAAIDAHYSTEATYDYFYNNFQRNSFDNNGAILKSYLHYSSNYANAFWNGSVMTYGDGDGVNYRPLVATEIVAHEISHAVTEHSADLIYSYESGALNESFSDIFGVAVDFYINPTRANYLMGEAVSYSNVPIRSMENPNQYGDPDTYMGTYWVTGSTDNGGVHTNSGVQNYWFYLLCEGGTGVNDLGNSYSVNAIGMEKAAKIAYRNLTVYLTPNSNYADARYYSILSAIDLFGDCSNEVIAVTNAWHAVGVGDKFNNKVISSFFTSTINTCKTPSTIHFYNNSLQASSYNWDFGNGFTDTTKNPIHTFNQEGNFKVTLISSGNTNCNNSDTSSLYISVNNESSIASPSCIPQTLNPGTGGIYKFNLSNFTKNTNGASENYQDYSCSDSIVVKEGKKYNLSLKIDDKNKSNVAIWIDLNNDGSFDENTELIFKKSNILYSISDSIIIPASTLTGSPLRLRVKTDKAEYPITDACSNSNYGQAHDYSIIINANNEAPNTNFSFNKSNIITGDSIQFTDKTLNLPTSWEWKFPGGIPSASNQQNPLVKYNIPGTYNVTLKTTNAYGSDSIIKTGVIIVTTPKPQGLIASIKNKDIGTIGLRWFLPSGDVDFEDFEDSTRVKWQILNGLWNFNNGSFNATTQNVSTSSAYLNNPFSEFEYEVSMRKTSGSTANMGICFNADPSILESNGTWKNGYILIYVVTGYWKFTKIVNGDWINIVNWEFSQNLNLGLNNWNTIKIIYSKGYFDILINNVVEGTYYDTTFNTGSVGVRMYDSQIGKGEFDNILLKQLNSSYTFGKVSPNQLLKIEDKSRNSNIFSPDNNSIIHTMPSHKPLLEETNKYHSNSSDSLENVFKNFKVYRDDALLTTTQNTYFVDTLPSYGSYNYKVSAEYDKGETEADSATVTWTEPNIGDNCSKAQDLNSLTSPYLGTTLDYNPDFTMCFSNSGPDRIFYVDLPAKSQIKYALKNYFLGAVLMVKVKGACPGDSTIFCDYSYLNNERVYSNSSDSTHRVYIIVGGYSSTYYGQFELEWQVDTESIPEANFSADKSFIKIGTSVNFKDLSRGLPSSWNWTFEGGTPSTSNLKNPTVTYNTPGEHNVTLIVSNSLGSDTISSDSIISVTNLNYCTENLGGYCPSDITNVSFTGTTLNNSNHENCIDSYNSGYILFPGKGNYTATLMGDSIYELSVTTSYYNIISVWIDFNQNGVFEATEWKQVATYTTPGVANKVLIPIPSYALTGKTLMRIRTRPSGSINGPTDACSSFYSGITEDYVITITQEPKIPVANFSAKQHVVVGETIYFSDLTSGVPTSWNWNFTGGTPSVSNVQKPSVTYNTPGTYSVKLVVSNHLGQDSIVKNNYITVTQGLPGEDCANMQNLATLTSPFSGTTTGYRSDFNFCSMNSPDRIFYIDIPAGGELTIGQTWNNFDSRHTLRVGGTCPGATEIICIDDPDEMSYTYINTSASTIRAYYTIAGFSSYSGDFILAWQLKSPGIPVVDFTANKTTIVRGSYVNFTDLTSGIPTSWRWSFPGGSPSISTSQNPSVYYSTPGTYSVTLEAYNSLGSDTLVKTNYITVTLPPKPVADFYANNTTVIKGNYVNFYDNSTNSPTSRKWYFPGGTPSTSTSSYPSIRYYTEGVYDVKLVVSNDGGSDSITRTGYINVIIPPKPVADFYANSTNVIVGNGTYFYSNSTNYPTTYKWTFNGGTPSTSTSSSPYISYNAPGTYDVKLVVSNAGGSDSIVKVKYITVSIPPKPVAIFTANATNITANNSVYFYDYSTNNPTSRKWYFEGGSPATSTYSSPTVYYYTPGVYSVKLVVSNPGGSDSLMRTGFITVSLPPKPVADFYASRTSGSTNSSFYFYDNSMNNPTTRKWSFDGGTPDFSTSSSPSVYYTNYGTYDVKLYVSNAGGSDSIIKTDYITVSKYCIANLGGNGYCPGNISNVAITGTTLNNNNHNRCNTNNSSTYASYPATGNNTASLQAGNTYELSVTSTTNCNISAWIDYDNNGNFDSYEWYCVASNAVANVPSKINITIPNYCKKGKTVMRIRTNATNNLNSSTSACTYFSFGITEDYTINLYNGNMDIVADTTKICRNGTVNFSCVLSTPATSYLWDFGLGSSPRTATTAGPHAVTYTTTGYKTVSLILNNRDTIIKADYIAVYALPSTPSITQTNGILYSNTAFGNQWYKSNSGAISGAVASNYKPVQSGNYYTIVSNGYGCRSSQSNTINFITTGNEAITQSGTISVFPNPFSDLLNISIDEKIKINKIEIRNLTGKLVYNQKVTNRLIGTLTLPLPHLSNGYYTMVISTDNKVYTYKLLKIN